MRARVAMGKALSLLTTCPGDSKDSLWLAGLFFFPLLGYGILRCPKGAHHLCTGTAAYGDLGN